ncbi:putative retroelement pol polyprotein [Cucumis melo var. makuwa]|uniref:Retroelement pol polyprotein n=1 Tax=Cucumis melo var. makuwa TaxID=1194695 RepID=A0A5A7TT18_CUCMM|nr:putative retroelement pol polyprotein [Cucumis melo var. makuwa]TYK28697.1 putative retroelement pol polyprotein [Cucumis melo var. makuwa]
MDFVDGLPKAAGFEVIFVIVDRLIKYGHFLPLKHLYSAKSVAELFVKEMFRLAGTKLNSSAYHPQSDGETEVAEYWYNTTFQRALGMTPFQVVYGRQPPPLIYYGDGTTTNATLDEQLKERNVALASLRDHLQLAHDQMKKYADQKRRHVEYELRIGWNYLIINPLCFSCVSTEEIGGEHINVQPISQQLNENYEWEANPVKAIDYRKNKTGTWEVMVSWEEQPNHEATWEVYEEMKCRYPNLHLEDKVNLEGRNNVRPPIIFQYSRKNKRKSHM